jgi:CRP-like cAMP-binding protein
VRESRFDPADKDLLDRIRRMPVFDAMDTDMLPEVLGRATVRRYEAGEAVITEGDADRFVYFLVSGSCAVSVDGTDVNALSAPGDVFGEMGFIEHKARSATVTAQTPTTCLTLDGAVIERMKGVETLAAQALFHRVFAEILAARIRHANARLLTLENELETLSVQRITF